MIVVFTLDEKQKYYNNEKAGDVKLHDQVPEAGSATGNGGFTRKHPLFLSSHCMISEACQWRTTPSLSVSLLLLQARLSEEMDIVFVPLPLDMFTYMHARSGV